MASIKPKLKYHLIEGVNPKTKAKLLRPAVAFPLPHCCPAPPQPPKPPQLPQPPKPALRPAQARETPRAAP